jgi:hypothetical protein
LTVKKANIHTNLKVLRASDAAGMDDAEEVRIKLDAAKGTMKRGKFEGRAVTGNITRVIN